MCSAGCCLVALATALLPAEVPGDGVLTLGRRTPLAVVTITSAGEQANTRTSALVAELRALIQEHTDLEIMLLEDAIPRSCQGALGCMTRRIRTDYDYAAFELPSGEVLPFSSHLERIERDRSVPRLLLVVSNFVKPGASDRVFAMLVDLDRALSIHHTASRKSEDWRESSDARIDEEAVLVRTPRVELFGEEDTRRFLKELVESQLQPTLSDRGHWHSFGRLEVSGTSAGSTVRIDGETAGLSAAGMTVIEEISAGAHSLGLEAPDGSTRRFEFIIEPGATVTLLVERSVVATERSSLRTTLIYGGMGLVAAGAVVTTVALAFGGGTVDRLCFEGGACSSRGAFAGTGQESISGLVEPNETGLLLGPLGYSVMITGGIFSLGSHMFTDEDEHPWWPLVLGVAAGGLSYGLSAALGSSP